MLALVVVVLSIGIIDSVNPSTIAPALYLATQKNAQRSIAGFILGVFVVYLLGGLVLTLGPGQVLIAALPHPRRETIHLIELALGGGALLLATFLWIKRERIARHLHRHERRVGGSSILLGGGIMAVELPTAFPYFAVVAAIAGSRRDVPTQIGLLLLFNAAFVAPLLAILAILRLAGEGGERTLENVHVRLHRHAAVLVPALVLVVAVVLMLLGATGLARE